MEDLKAEEINIEEIEQSTNTMQNTDNTKTNVASFDVENQKNSQEVSIETPSESIDIKTEDANTTNCLALTIQQDHKIVAFKNVFLRSIRMSWKVVVSTITLALIKLFS